MDELAGGAWLAADHSTLAVLLNRAGGADGPVLTTRGALVLDAVDRRPLPDPLTTLGAHQFLCGLPGRFFRAR
jgi:hypothetical protein